MDPKLCAKCKGRGWCGKPCPFYSKIKPITKTHFSGSSPPEIFIGRHNYPNINAGILSPEKYGSFEQTTSPELWHKNNLSISEILSNRGELIYSKFKTQIKKSNKFTQTMQELSLAHKSVSTEFFLKKPPKYSLNPNKNHPAIGNPAPLKKAQLQENPKVKRKVGYLVSDTDNKAANSIKELHNTITTSHISKILSAGLLGLKTQRKLVPTRWSITAVDDTLSKDMLKKIKYYPEISEILLFNSEYNGNHYEILLLPDNFSFEVIEAKMPGSTWNPGQTIFFMKDYEFFKGRKTYADEVTGAYYANRLALSEYLEKIKKQATCLVLREVRPEYYAPLGVGILREATRHAFSKKPETFPTIQEALQRAQKRMKLPIQQFKQQSTLLREYGKQKKLSQFF